MSRLPHFSSFLKIPNYEGCKAKQEDFILFCVIRSFYERFPRVIKEIQEEKITEIKPWNVTITKPSFIFSVIMSSLLSVDSARTPIKIAYFKHFL